MTSVLLQGTTIAPVARWLGVDTPIEESRTRPLEYVMLGDRDGVEAMRRLCRNGGQPPGS